MFDSKDTAINQQNMFVSKMSHKYLSIETDSVETDILRPQCDTRIC